MLLDDLKTHLAAHITGLSTSNIFIDYAPDQPENCLILYGYGGTPPNNPLVQYEQAKRVQILARYKVGKDATNILKLIENEIYVNNDGSLTLNNTRKCIFNPISEISFLKQENNRFHYIINVEILSKRD